MKHIGQVSKLPVVASDTGGTVDIGGIIKGAGKATGSIIFASAVATGIKAAVDILDTIDFNPST